MRLGGVLQSQHSTPLTFGVFTTSATTGVALTALGGTSFLAELLREEQKQRVRVTDLLSSKARLHKGISGQSKATVGILMLDRRAHHCRLQPDSV